MHLAHESSIDPVTHGRSVHPMQADLGIEHLVHGLGTAGPGATSGAGPRPTRDLRALCRRARDLLQVVLELPRPGRVAQLAQRLRLDLADPFAGDVELLADLFEGPRPAVLQPETKLEHAPLTPGQ